MSAVRDRTLCLLCLGLLSILPAEGLSQSTSQASSIGGTDLQLSGFLRARYGAIFEGDSNPTFVGINDGFFLDAARLTLDARKNRLTARISIDGAVDRRSALNTAEGQVDVGLVDGWLAYRFHDNFTLQVGQFKLPFDQEELLFTRDMLFVERSVASRGVRGIEGYNASGLSLRREVGAMGHFPLRLGAGIETNLWIAVTNGSGANRPTNDNDDLAYTARLDIGSDKARLGGAYRYNEVTNGNPPDLLVDEVRAYTADVSLRHDFGPVGISILAVYWYRSRESVDVPTEPEMISHGYQGTLGVHLPMKVVLAYRASGFDPTLDFEAEDPGIEAVLDSDALLYHTIGVTYDMEDTPLKLQANYTVTQEESDRALENDRFDLVIQAAF